jgi:Big-like domain-containing protein
MNKLMRRVAAGLALPLAVGAPVVLLASPAHADSATTLVSSDAQSVYGQEVTVTATVTSEGILVPRGTVLFEVDSQPLGSPVPVVNGRATSPVLTGPGGEPVAVGAHNVTADFVPDPADGSAYFPTTQGVVAQMVDKAGSTLAVLPGPTGIVADLTGALPGGVQAGSVKPSGTVTFTVGGAVVGTAPVAANGRATLAYVVPPGAARTVAASYPGDERYTGSADAVVRLDPEITARVLGKFPKSRSGWYRTPVDVVFSCRPHGSELAEDCPLELTLRKSGANQSVTRTVHAVDGGAATVVVTGIDIDRDKPEVSIVNGRCRASDDLSGVKSCTLRTAADGRVLIAIATDKAGNRAVARVVQD